MTELVFIQGGTGWRRTWRRELGTEGGPIVVLNGHARDYAVRDGEGAFSIKWMPKGRAVYRTGGVSHPLAGEWAVILNAGQPYELEFLGRGGTESLCVFFPDALAAEAFAALDRPDLVDEPGRSGSLPPEFPEIVARPEAAVGRRIGELRGAYGADNPAEETPEEALLELLLALARQAHGLRRVAANIPALKPTTRRSLLSRLERARELIEDSPLEPPSLDALARESALSKFHLLRLFKAAFGCTPSAYAQRMRIERAKALLKAGAGPSAEIGLLVGYESESAFFRAFRRHTGLTPLAFRGN